MYSSLLGFLILAIVAAQTAASSSSGNGNITFVIGTGGLFFQCTNGQWTDFGMTTTVKVFIDGTGPHQPMMETGLPTIQMSWFINGAEAYATLTNSFGVGNVTCSKNVISFNLLDNEPIIGGNLAVGSCNQEQIQPQPVITVSLTSNTFINGQGFPPIIPAASGVPHIVNEFPAANNGGSVYDQGINSDIDSHHSSHSPISSTPFIAAGIGVVAFACAAGLAVFGVRRYKQRKNREFHLVEESRTGSLYISAE